MGEVPGVTGRWAGHYAQFGRENGITANLVQDGETLTGTMTDGEPRREQSVFEAAAQAGWPPGADEQIVARLRELFPDRPGAAIRYLTEMPATSVLEGKARGGTISFVKTYRGEMRSGYLVGDQFVGETLDRHEVHYRGRLSADGTRIEGKWWIPRGAGLGAPRLEGDFLLRRTGP